jgi:hypothetical protein
MNIEESIRILLPRNVDYLIGYANLQGLLPEKYRGFDYAVVLARRLDDRIIDAIIDGPNIEYYNHYEEVNFELAKVAHGLADAIRLEGSKSLVIEPTIQDKDLDKIFLRPCALTFLTKWRQHARAWAGSVKPLFLSPKNSALVCGSLQCLPITLYPIAPNQLTKANAAYVIFVSDTARLSSQRQAMEHPC